MGSRAQNTISEFEDFGRFKQNSSMHGQPIDIKLHPLPNDTHSAVDEAELMESAAASNEM